MLIGVWKGFAPRDAMLIIEHPMFWRTVAVNGHIHTRLSTKTGRIPLCSVPACNARNVPHRLPRQMKRTHDVPPKQTNGTSTAQAALARPQERTVPTQALGFPPMLEGQRRYHTGGKIIIPSVVLLTCQRPIGASERPQPRQTRVSAPTPPHPPCHIS